jgi:hypothetical protein
MECKLLMTIRGQKLLAIDHKIETLTIKVMALLVMRQVKILWIRQDKVNALLVNSRIKSTIKWKMILNLRLLKLLFPIKRMELI